MTNPIATPMDEEIAILEAERTELFKQLQPLQDRLTPLHTRLSELKDARDEMRVAAQVAANAAALDIPLMLGSSFDETMPMHRERNRQLALIGLRANGYWVDTLQTVVQIMLFRGDPVVTKRTYEGLMILLPHIKPDEAGAKRIAIFDHRLSEDGGWKLCVYEGKVVVQNKAYEHERYSTEFPDLMAALEYCEERHYYEVAQKKRKRV